MKKIFKFSILCLLFIVASCTNETKDPITVANGFSLSNDASIISPSILSTSNESDTFGKYDWTLSDNGSTTIAKYNLVIFDHDNDPDLLYPVEYKGSGLTVTLNSRKATLTNKEINILMNDLKNFKCSEMSIDIRIKSSVGANPIIAFVQYSNPINVKVTGYKTTPLTLAFGKDGNSVNTEPKVLSTSYTSNTDFEGYVYLQPGSYKFYQPDACGSFTGATTLGGAGGVLSATGAAINIATAGYYLIKANLTANTYAIKEYKAFGIFGTAVRTLGSALGTPMISNNDNKWSITIDLFKGRKFKFKAGALNSAIPPAIPTTNVVSALGKSSTGQLSDANPDYTDSVGQIIVPGVDDGTKVSCTIKADLSNPRNYTYKLVTQ